MLLSCLQIVLTANRSSARSITSGKLHDLDYNRTPRRRSIYFYIFGVWSLNDVHMSSKVNNKVPHTRINSIGTSFAQAQAQAKMTIVRRCLLRHFGSGRRKTGSRIETHIWIDTRPTPRQTSEHARECGCDDSILIPRGRAPFGQHQESRPLA